MRRLAIIFSMVMLAVVVLPACRPASSIPPQDQEVKVDGRSYRDITPAQLKVMLKNKDFLFVNVHIPYGGEISGTDLFVTYNEIERNLSQFPENKGAKIVLYCRSDSMSTIATRTLVSLGFSNLANLDGGMAEWEKQGYELIHKSQ